MTTNREDLITHRYQNPFGVIMERGNHLLTEICYHCKPSPTPKQYKAPPGGKNPYDLADGIYQKIWDAGHEVGLNDATPAEHHELRLILATQDNYRVYCPCGWTTYVDGGLNRITDAYTQHLPNRFAHESTETEPQ